MTREGYLDYWRSLTREEKRVEARRWILDMVGGFALIGAMVGVFAVLPQFVAASWWAWETVRGWF